MRGLFASTTGAHKDSYQTAIVFKSNKLRASTYLPFFMLPRPGHIFFATGPDGAMGFGSPGLSLMQAMVVGGSGTAVIEIVRVGCRSRITIHEPCTVQNNH